MRQNDTDQTIVSMQLSELELEALERSRTLLRHSGSLFCDSVFDHEPKMDPVVDGCLNPLRALGDSKLNQVSISVSFDTNYLVRLVEILEMKPGTRLNNDEHRVLATVALSGLCSASLSPGFALAEMLSGGEKSSIHLHAGFRAFNYLCVDCPLEDILTSVVNGTVPIWKLPIPRQVSPPLNTIRLIAGNRKSKSELFASLCAGIVERKHKTDLDQDAKLEAFFSRIFETGALAAGSMRYFAFYFSGETANHNIPRRSMLKGIHSNSRDKAAAGIRNAARDCYLASEYSSSLNSFHERNIPRVFATEDRALQFLLSKDCLDRDVDYATFASSLRSLRGGMLPTSVEMILEENVSYIPVEEAKLAGVWPLRESARNFLEDPDRAISRAWAEFDALF